MIILSVLLIIVIMTGLVWYLMAEQAKRSRRILHAIGTRKIVKNKDKEAAEQKQKNIAKRLEKLASENAQKKTKDGLSEKIAQAGLSISLKVFWAQSTVFAILAVLILKALGMDVIFVIAGFLFGLLVLPRQFISMKVNGRQKNFLKEFPDALEGIVRLLKSGMPVTEAISMVSNEFSGPVGEEMAKIYEAQKIGTPLAEATLQAAHRMPIPEMQMLATGIAIQQQTGSSLSEAIQNLADTIRARHRLKRKVVALSSEAKTSAMIIGALPVFVASMLYLINPEYIGLLFDHTVGKFLSGGAVVWMMIGVLVMRGMINFKV